MEFREIYCVNCKKTLGRYNIKYYPESRIAELIKAYHEIHVKKGHELSIRRIKN